MFSFCLISVGIIPLVLTSLKGSMRCGGIIFHQQDTRKKKISGHAPVQGSTQQLPQNCGLKFSFLSSKLRHTTQNSWNRLFKTFNTKHIS